MANRNETLAEATRLYETVSSPKRLVDVQADQAFNTLDKSITVSEENLLNPPSSTYFLASPPPEEEEEEEEEDVNLSDISPSDADEAGETASVKTDDLTPAYLHDSELKALRRRMKKSFQWVPTPVCIKRELQLNGRWPLQITNQTARRKRKLAKIKRKRQRQVQKIKRDSVLTVQKGRVEKNKFKKKRDSRFTIPATADEPTYCYCSDVSYGEMIACENEVTLFHGPTDFSFVRENGFIWSVLD